jgi:hypothetical protein
MIDLPGLVRRDHDDLDAVLATLIDPATPASETAELLDTAQLVLAVHVTAETRVLLEAAQYTTGDAMTAILAILDGLRREHGQQADLLRRAGQIAPATPAWYEQLIEVRALALDHRWRAPRALERMRERLPEISFHAFAADYATWRLVALSTFS